MCNSDYWQDDIYSFDDDSDTEFKPPREYNPKDKEQPSEPDEAYDLD